MIVPHIRHGASRLALLGMLLLSSLAFAAGQGRAVNPLTAARGALLRDAGVVEFCDEGTTCRSSRHPVAAGAVRQIVAGDFVKSAQASWIAMSERAVSLCYLGAASGAITCTPIANGVEALRDTHIAYVDLDDGTRTLKFTARGADPARGAGGYSPYPFMAGLGAAAAVLQKHAARQHGDAALASTAFQGGGNGDVCSFSDGGDVTCTGAGSAPGMVGSVGGAGNDVAGNASAAQTGGQGNGWVSERRVERARSENAPEANDSNAVATVFTGTGERPAVEFCRAEAAAGIRRCDDPRKRLGNSAHRSCMANVEANRQDCMAEAGDDSDNDMRRQ